MEGSDAMADAEIVLRLTAGEIAELLNVVAEESMRSKDQMLLLNPIRSKLLGAKKLWRSVGARQAIGGFPGMTALGARVAAEQAGRTEQTEGDNSITRWSCAVRPQAAGG
jgi:hypothetical protein